MMRIVAILICLSMAQAAAAHSLRIYATVIGDRIEGYGFFVGGGRPAGVDWRAGMEDRTIASGTTDAMGRFEFPVPRPVTAAVTITIDAGDGHMIHATLERDRFARGTSPAPAPGAAAPSPAPETPVAHTDSAAIATMIDASVARQIAPLLARIEQMDARMRITDLLSGLFLIFGLAGMALWVRSGRR